MYNHLVQLIKQNYNIEVIDVEVIARHGATVYLLESTNEKYALKEMGMDDKLEGEGKLIECLINKGVSVPKIYHTIAGNHVFTDNGLQYILYEFIDGETIDLNAAPNWFLIKSAQTLGQIQDALKDCKPLSTGFSQNFFAKEKYTWGEQSIKDKIKQAEEKKDTALAMALNERLKHIKRVSRFDFDCDKLTYVNTHGDFYTNQIIVRGEELVTIDWTGGPSCSLACFEVLMSYTYAAPDCKDGVIDIEKFKPYLSEYLKYAPIKLSQYDLKMMPYFLYHYCIFCSFTPPYDDLSDDYHKIANLTDNLANWLYDNVDILSQDLCSV